MQSNYTFPSASYSHNSYLTFDNLLILETRKGIWYNRKNTLLIIPLKKEGTFSMKLQGTLSKSQVHLLQRVTTGRLFFWSIVKLEVISQSCSVKKMFLEISQNSQRNACARVFFFNKVAGCRLQACPNLGLRVGPVGRDFVYFDQGHSRPQGLTAFWYKLGHEKRSLYPRLLL